jgi:hypothetical protein
MKKILKELIITKIFFILLIVVGCTQEKSTIINENVDNRIKLKETRVIEGYSYVIIEVDGVEYLSAARSGIVRISK